MDVRLALHERTYKGRDSIGIPTALDYPYKLIKAVLRGISALVRSILPADPG